MKAARPVTASGRPYLTQTKGETLIDERIYDIAPITTWTAQDGRTISTAEVVNWWIEATLEGPWSGWIVACRIMADDRGLPVIAELRVFPAEARRNTGEWSAEVLGDRARSSVPRSGLPATLIRRGLPLTALFKIAGEAFQAISHIQSIKPERPNLHGIDVDARATEFREKLKGGTTTGRGRPRLWGSGDYARVALTYDDAKRHGRSPIDAISRSEGISSANARNLVAQARKAGKLPQADGSGKKTPVLSPKMRAALKREATARRKSRR